MKKTLFISVKVDPITKQILPVGRADQIKFDMFMKAHTENCSFQLILTLEDEEKTVSQLAKIHGAIRDVAEFSGMGFTEIKKHIKREASLYEYNGEVTELKSFRNCTKKELDAAIKTIEQFAANIGCVLTV